MRQNDLETFYLYSFAGLISPSVKRKIRRTTKVSWMIMNRLPKHIMVKIYIFIGIFIAFSSVGHTKTEEIHCAGANWSYKFLFQASTCEHEMKVIKEIPKVYKKGHIQKMKSVSPEECWKQLRKFKWTQQNAALWNQSRTMSLTANQLKLFIEVFFSG